MTNYTVNLSPNLVNMATEGGMDASLLNGNSLQRTAHNITVVNGTKRKIVGKLKDGDQFNNTIKQFDNMPHIVKLSGDIYLFINNSYVDYVEGGEGTGSEPNNLMDFMDSVGISYETFTDISSSAFENLSPNSKLIIPELEEGDLLPDLSNEAKSAIQNFVNNGGTLVMFQPTSGDLIDFLNDIFSFSLSDSGSDEPISLSMAGASLFPNESPTIPSNNGTDGLDTTTLPMGSVSIYEGDGANQTVVAMMPYGSGKIYVLGWDWYNAAPTGSQDGGWNNLLQSILES